MYIEHPYFYEGKYYANIDGEMIEITKEVAYAMNNFYRSSKAKKVEIIATVGDWVLAVDFITFQKWMHWLILCRKKGIRRNWKMEAFLRI